jgi:DMSO/TMAO reductase YedYZ molybdopterin-dependent catalytic subunit
VASLLGGGAVAWVATRPDEDGIPWPLRRVLRFNERMAEAIYNPQRRAPEFARPSTEHPQTLLCVEMNGQNLSEGDGAPRRWVSTVKYGYKCIKRVSVIDLTDERPADYWGKRGHDSYGGH